MTSPLKPAPSEATWYFDVVSPFAYLALPAVEAIARRHLVRFRPVLLGALLSRWGQLGPAEVAPKRLCTYRLVQFTAGRSGLKLRFPPRHPFRSLDAKPVGRHLWSYDEVEPHWDQLVLRSFAVFDGTRVLYQEGPLAALLCACWRPWTGGQMPCVPPSTLSGPRAATSPSRPSRPMKFAW
jgi:hypothetical protein